MNLLKLKSDYEPLIAEFGDNGAAIVSGIMYEKVPEALKTENNDSLKLEKFLASRKEGYEKYDEQKQDLLLKLEHLIAESGSAASAAKMIGESPSTISDIRKGKYKGNVQKFFNGLDSYFNVKKEHAKTYKAVGYVPTSISEGIYQTIRNCHIVGACEIITGDTGIGKTRTIKQYMKDYPEDTILITPSYADSSVVGAMKLIAEQLGINGLNRLADLNKAVTNKLHDGMLIIVDEAQHLSFPAIDHLRTMADKFIDNDETLGVCFIGNASFNRHFAEKKLPITGQVWNRSSLRPNFVSEDVKLDDIKLLFPELTAQNKNAELKFLLAIAQTNGEGIRRAINFYKNAYNANNGNVELEYLASLAQFGNARIPNIGAIIKRLKEEAAA